MGGAVQMGRVMFENSLIGWDVLNSYEGGGGDGGGGGGLGGGGDGGGGLHTNNHRYISTKTTVEHTCTAQ